MSIKDLHPINKIVHAKFTIQLTLKDTTIFFIATN